MDQLLELLLVSGEEVVVGPQAQEEVRLPLQQLGLEEVELQVQVVRSQEEQAEVAVLVVGVAFPLLWTPPCLEIRSPPCHYTYHVSPHTPRIHIGYGSVEQSTSSCPS